MLYYIISFNCICSLFPMKMQIRFLLSRNTFFICALLYQWHAIKRTFKRGIGCLISAKTRSIHCEN